MKRLTLVRHAHAESENCRGADFERRLSKRGHTESEALGKHLLSQNLVPDLLIASSAQRTRQTADILMRELSLTPSAVKYDERLYLASAEDILRIVQAVDQSVRHLMIVSHNPGISDLAKLLAGDTRVSGLGTAEACSMIFDSEAWTVLSDCKAVDILQHG